MLFGVKESSYIIRLVVYPLCTLYQNSGVYKIAAQVTYYLAWCLICLFFVAKAQLLGRYLRLNQHTNIIHGRYRPCSACRQQYHPWSNHWYGNFKVRRPDQKPSIYSGWLPATTFKICIYCYILIKLDHIPKSRGINSKEILETTKLLRFFLNWQTSKLWNLDNSSPTSPSTPIVKLKQAVATCISLGRVHLSRKYSNFCWPYRSNYKHQEFTLSSPALWPRANLKIGDQISTCFLGWQWPKKD